MAILDFLQHIPGPTMRIAEQCNNVAVRPLAGGGGAAVWGVDSESGRQSRAIVVPDDFEQEQLRRSRLAITRLVHKMLNDAVAEHTAEIHFVRDHAGIDVSFADSRESTTQARPPLELWPGIVDELCVLFSIDSPIPATMGYETDSGKKVRFRMTIADTDKSLVLQVIDLSEP
jgi:hypothetical protein